MTAGFDGTTRAIKKVSAVMVSITAAEAKTRLATNLVMSSFCLMRVLRAWWAPGWSGSPGAHHVVDQAGLKSEKNTVNG